MYKRQLERRNSNLLNRPKSRSPRIIPLERSCDPRSTAKPPVTKTSQLQIKRLPDTDPMLTQLMKEMAAIHGNATETTYPHNTYLTLIITPPLTTDPQGPASPEPCKPQPTVRRTIPRLNASKRHTRTIPSPLDLNQNDPDTETLRQSLINRAVHNVMGKRNRPKKPHNFPSPLPYRELDTYPKLPEPPIALLSPISSPPIIVPTIPESKTDTLMQALEASGLSQFCLLYTSPSPRD